MSTDVQYKGYVIRVETFGSQENPGPWGHYTEVEVEGLLTIQLDFAAPFYALDVARHAIDLKVAERVGRKSSVG